MKALSFGWFWLFLILSAPVLGSAPKDMIVMLDMSESQFDYSDEVVEVFLAQVLRQHLQPRDTFHLITYSDKPELEITRRIDGVGSVEDILKRLLLLQALGRYSDLLTALVYLQQYGQSLNPQTPKTIFILSDGIHNPPRDGSVLSPEAVQFQFQQRIRAMQDYRWSVKFIRIPPLGAGQDQLPEGQIQVDFSAENLKGVLLDYRQDERFVPQALDSPRVRFPQGTLQFSPRFSLPLGFDNFSDRAVLLRLTQVLFRGENILVAPTTITLAPGESREIPIELQLTKELPEGIDSSELELVFEDRQRAFPNQGTVEHRYETPWAGWPWLIGFGLLVAASLIAFLLFRLFKWAVQRSKRFAEEHEFLIMQAQATAISDSETQALEPKTSSPRSVPVVSPRNFVQPSKANLSAKIERPVSKIPRPSIKAQRSLKDPALAAHLYFLSVRTPDWVYQNSDYGRNILVLKPEDKVQIGGVWAKWQIFLHTVDRPLAEVFWQDGTLMLKPLGPGFGQDQEPRPCLDRDLPVELDSGRHLILRIQRHRSKLDQLNSLFQR